MWNNGEDVNDCGEPVELYLPVRVPARKTNIAPQDSHIGGLPCFGESFTPCCDLCGDKMFLLAQLQLKLSSEMERYLCVFSCPREDCFGQISFDKGFASSSEGVKGVVKCIEKRVPIAGSETKAKVPVVAKVSKSSWYDDNDDGNNSDDDDWGTGGDDDGKVNLENAVAAMERKLDDGGAIVMTPSNKSASKAKPSSLSADEALRNAFGCYLLTKQMEPASSKYFLEDEDDVGLSKDDEKIRNMLARYMAEEEDEDILAALGGTSLGGGGGNNGEEDERLSEEDRVLRGFQDRQKRAPRQVIRCASGGKPLWSIPDRNRKSGKTLWSVPESSSGGPVRFEFQVLPSILAAIEADEHPATKTATKTTSDGETTAMALDQLLSNGVNFGSIAVFTDPTAAAESGEQEAFVVIQKSVDDLPEQRGPANNSASCGEGFPAASMAVVEDLDDDEEFELDA
jgi:hypothetical protein